MDNEFTTDDIPIRFTMTLEDFLDLVKEKDRLREALKKIADLKIKYTWDVKDNHDVMINFKTLELAITMAEDALKESK
jgi:hypothetical protein